MSVTINAEVRRCIYLDAAFSASGPAERVGSGFNRMYPCPMNDMTSITPDVEKVKETIGLVSRFVELFDLIGWGLDDEREQYELPGSMVPTLWYMLGRARDEMEDHSNVLVRRIEVGAIEPGDWLPLDHRKRDVEDLILEQSYYLWNILEEFGVRPPLAPQPEPVEDEEVKG